MTKPRGHPAPCEIVGRLVAAVVEWGTLNIVTMKFNMEEGNRAAELQMRVLGDLRTYALSGPNGLHLDHGERNNLSLTAPLLLLHSIPQSRLSTPFLPPFVLLLLIRMEHRAAVTLLQMGGGVSGAAN